MSDNTPILKPADRHLQRYRPGSVDAVLAEWELTLDEATRERLRGQGYRLASDAA
jgi:hypothetical protein